MITIIVLLILAGITISMLTGQNGILNRASEAKEQTEIAQIKERARIDILGVQLNNNGEITVEQLDQILTKYGTISGEGEDRIITTDKQYVIKVTDIYNGISSEVEGVDKSLLQVGDYVNYPVNYNNVNTNGSEYEISYTDWRILSVEETGENSYVRLVSAGVPLDYRYSGSTRSYNEIF